MNRRKAIKNMTLYLPILGFCTRKMDFQPKSTLMKLEKAKKLRPGDKIGLVAPGSSVSAEKLEKAIKNIESLGLQVEFGKNSKNKKGFLAGEDQGRIEDLHYFFSRKDIKGIWCLRGGYGSARILDQLDYKLIKRNPKIFIGYSDITALLNSIYKKSRLLTFHGPMATSQFTAFSVKQLKATLMVSESPPSILASPEIKEIIHPGQASGRLLGGNLSLIASLCGSGYLPKFKNNIIFIEDIGEKPYRIDRMLTQLLLSTDLKEAAGIALGVFEDCEAGSNDNSLTLLETFKDRLANLEIPVIYGFPFGHISDNAILPFGMEVRLDSQSGQLQFLENAVID